MDPLSRGLLDTSVLIGRDEDAQPIASLPDFAAISVASLAELHFGVLVARDDVTRQIRLRRIGAIEAAFEPLPIDATVARCYATVAHAIHRAGRQPRRRVMDLWIAATALALNLPLFTRNAADFAGLETLIDVRAV